MNSSDLPVGQITVHHLAAQGGQRRVCAVPTFEDEKHVPLVQNLEPYGVDLYLDQRNIDTTTPAGKLMFQITGAFAEFERSMIRQRVKLGIKRAVAQGKHLGRPAIAPELERKAQRQLRKGTGILKVAKLVGLGTGTVHRIKREMGA
jgi:DNA invertase Pin-like site-specific DNA recombinase